MAMAATFTFAAPAPIALAQQVPTTKSLEGVWRITKVVTAGVIDTHPQPSLQIFSRGYYAIIRDNAKEARQASVVAKDSSKLTVEEKLARYDEWAPYAASAGTYEVKGDTLVTHNIVAKNVAGSSLTEEATIKFAGDTFVAAPEAGSALQWPANDLYPCSVTTPRSYPPEGAENALSGSSMQKLFR